MNCLTCGAVHLLFSHFNAGRFKAMITDDQLSAALDTVAEWYPETKGLVARNKHTMIRLIRTNQKPSADREPEIFHFKLAKFNRATSPAKNESSAGRKLAAISWINECTIAIFISVINSVILVANLLGIHSYLKPDAVMARNLMKELPYAGEFNGLTGAAHNLKTAGEGMPKVWALLAYVSAVWSLGQGIVKVVIAAIWQPSSSWEVILIAAQIIVGISVVLTPPGLPFLIAQLAQAAVSVAALTDACIDATVKCANHGEGSSSDMTVTGECKLHVRTLAHLHNGFQSHPQVCEPIQHVQE
jgi:hypothetical protein